MQLAAVYPTEAHRLAAETLVEYFSSEPVDAVLLVNSCARGKATPDSCVDIGVLVPESTDSAGLDAYLKRWNAFYNAHPAFESLRQAGRYSVVHLDFFTGQFEPEGWDDGGGPDGFELGVGNALAYSVPLSEQGDHLQRLKAGWLPYYDEELRLQRLQMVQAACRYDLDHVPTFVARGLYFQAFDRLYKAYQEFLQALFIAKRTYPIAYNKWIYEQVVEILGLPALYEQLPALFEIARFESEELNHKAEILQGLLDRYTTA